MNTNTAGENQQHDEEEQKKASNQSPSIQPEPPTPELPLKPENQGSSEQKKQPVPTPLQIAQAQAAEYLLGWKRAQADYQNLVRETERRVRDISKYATEAFIHELLPIVDHFQLAFTGVPAAEKESSWLKGIEHIYNNLLRILEAHGVEMIKSVGERFDPHRHEAVEEVEMEGGVSGTIAVEVASGFKLNGKVIRCAKVKVIK